MGGDQGRSACLANSIPMLVTSRARATVKGQSAFEAALSAGHTRIRPVLMDAAR